MDELERAARWINSANNVVAFTGAGISVESGQSAGPLYYVICAIGSLNSFSKLPRISFQARSGNHDLIFVNNRDGKQKRILLNVGSFLRKFHVAINRCYIINVNFALCSDPLPEINGIFSLGMLSVYIPTGIPDFRSPGGLWSKYDPAIYCDFHTFKGKYVADFQVLLHLVSLFL